MELEFLGTGTSFGVPEIGCQCAVCVSPDPRDGRLRCSVWLRHGPWSLAVDTPPDFRYQCLRAGITRLDAILLTHLHADHIFGLDDVRKFNRLQSTDVPVYLPVHMLPRFQELFGYAMRPPRPGITVPRFDLRLVDQEPLGLGDLRIQPIPINHGAEEIRGYLFQVGERRLAYLTDCKFPLPVALPWLQGVDILILGALWSTEWTHPGHLNLAEAIALSRQLGAQQTYFTHLTHWIGPHATASLALPPGMALAHDRLVLTL